VRVLDSVEHNQQLRLGRNRREIRILLRCSERDYSLMRFGARQTVERPPIFETDGSSGLPGQINHLLHTLTGKAFRDQYPLEWAFRPKRFNDGVNSNENGQIRL